MFNRGIQRITLAALLLLPLLGLHRASACSIKQEQPSASLFRQTADTPSQSLPPAFALSPPSPAELRLVPGQASMANLVLTANASFSGKVAVTCSGATPRLDCLISPASISLAPGQSITATVAVATQGAATPMAQTWSPLWTQVGRSLTLASVFLVITFRRHRPGRTGWSALLLLATGLAASSLLGCSKAFTNSSATPPGDTTLQITASSSTMTATRSLIIHVTGQKRQTP